jgi:hypothetical protein
MKEFLVVAVLSALSACALPETTVDSGSAHSGLVVKGAPQGSVLYVDSIQVGSADQYSGSPNVLVILQGTHQVEIRDGSTVIYRDKVYVDSGETRTITVLKGSVP